MEERALSVFEANPMTSEVKPLPEFSRSTLAQPGPGRANTGQGDRVTSQWDTGQTTVRRVQRTGVCSLAVTLPKDWTDSMGVRHGDALRFHDLGHGALELTPDRDQPRAEEEPHAVTIAVTDAPALLLGQLLAGAYVAGQDRIVLTSRKPFSEAQRETIHRGVTQIPGLRVIAEVPDVISLVVSVDPTKRRLSGLVDHMAQLVQHEFALYRRALAQRSTLLLSPVENIEEDLSRTHLLFARALLMAMRDPRIAQKIGAEGPRNQVGYQVVGAAISSVGEQSSSLARSLSGCMHSACLSVSDCSELGARIAGAEELLALTMQAFNQVSASDAHLALSTIDAARQELTSLLGLPNGGKRCAMLRQQSMAVLLSIGELLRAVNRETLNRSVEPSAAERLGGRLIVLQPAA